MRTRSLVVPAFLIGILILQACGGDHPQSTLAPSSDVARSIDGLFRTIVWWALGVLVVVAVALFYTLVRFRERPGGERPKPIHGHTVLEIGWTLPPAIILIAIAIPTIQTIFVIDRPPETEALVIEATGHQWWWEFHYPESGIVTANEAHIPVGRTVDFRLRSADVLHSFWVPKLGGKRDMVPGRENMLWFTADSAGDYWGQCAEYCGTDHALMLFRIIADEPDQFDAWLASEAQPAETPDDDAARRGRRVFTGNACVGCHTVRGTAEVGAVFGPDLTHIGSRTTIGAGILENTRENLERWLRETQEVKPGNLMPQISLTDEEIRDLAAYLMSLR